MPAAVGRPALIGRLKKRSEFLAVAASNRKWSSPGLVLQSRRQDHDQQSAGQPITGRPPIRLGFTATKKIGNAVARNRARRRLRAAAAEILRDRVPAVAVDLVLVARRDTIERPFADLKNDLESGLRRLGVLT